MKTDKLFGVSAIKNAKTMTAVAIEVIVAVIVIPIVQTIITDANFSGTTGTIMNYVPLFLALAVLVLVVVQLGLGKKG
jgi:hypothetical protein